MKKYKKMQNDIKVWHLIMAQKIVKETHKHLYFFQIHYMFHIVRSMSVEYNAEKKLYDNMLQQWTGWHATYATFVLRVTSP